MKVGEASIVSARGIPLYDRRTTMDPKLVAVIVVVAIVAGLTVLWAIARNQRTAELRRRFGAEYDRTVRMTGARRAETLLMERERRVETFPIRQLGAEEREKFITEWRLIQSRFVDGPRGAVEQADLLVERVMRARGYPLTDTDFEQRAADISVAHASVVVNYRAAHEIALRHRQGQATTEDLRTAIVYYRSLFDDLLVTGSMSIPQKEVA
jgi:hypothetical protein